jgi:hypothetical protein
LRSHAHEGVRHLRFVDPHTQLEFHLAACAYWWLPMPRQLAFLANTLLLACSPVPESPPSSPPGPYSRSPCLVWPVAYPSPFELILISDKPSLPPDDELDAQVKDPWKSLACTKACEAGGEAMEAFCGALPNNTRRQKTIRQACWASSRATKGACIVFCNAYFGPPAQPRH